MHLFKISLGAALALLCNCVYADVNINTATEQQLMEQLQNIGPAKAAAIVEYRTRHGRFTDVGQLTEVGGIGEATLERNRHLLNVGDAAHADDAAGGSGTAPGAAPTPATMTGEEPAVGEH